MTLRFKKNDGSDFPDWEEKKLGEIGMTYNGLTNKNSNDFGAGKPYIQYKQVFDQSKIDLLKCGLVNIDEDEKQSKVQYGDVLFTLSSETPDEVGYASVLLNHIDEDLYLNSFCFGFRINISLMSEYFAPYLFHSTYYRDAVVRLAQGSTRYNISKIKFLNIIVDIPCLEEQQKIATCLSDLDNLIEKTKEKLEKYKELKKSLMQHLFK